MEHKELIKKIKKLSPVEYEVWDERAAIMEYEGGLPREKAEIEAYKCLLKYCKSQNS